MGCLLRQHSLLNCFSLFPEEGTINLHIWKGAESSWEQSWGESKAAQIYLDLNRLLRAYLAGSVCTSQQRKVENKKLHPQTWSLARQGRWENPNACCASCQLQQEIWLCTLTQGTPGKKPLSQNQLDSHSLLFLNLSQCMPTLTLRVCSICSWCLTIWVCS